MPQIPVQAQSSIEKNADFFQENLQYIRHQERLEIYKLIRLTIEREMSGVNSLLDVGNGGFFNYNTDAISEVIALDLMLEDNRKPAPNILFRKGSVLALPFADETFDCVLSQNILHHITGETVRDNRMNMMRAVHEIARVLKPSGKIVILESTVPAWFHNFIEIPLYGVLFKLWDFKHPLTFQYTREQIAQQLTGCGLQIIEQVSIPRGNAVIQFGIVVPTLLTPIQAIKFVAIK